MKKKFSLEFGNKEIVIDLAGAVSGSGGAKPGWNGLKNEWDGKMGHLHEERAYFSCEGSKEIRH